MDMSSVERVEGPNLTLRLIQPEDAAYVHGLRTNPAYNRHLSEVRGTVETQRQWIEGYKSRETGGHELYYVIERKDNTRCGLVRLYDIDEMQFTWGSWVLDENKPRKAALESAVLSFGAGFDALGCDLAQVDVRVDNARAEAFYRRFGMSETHRTATNIFFEYSRARFEEDRKQHLVVINGPSAKE
jgi:RimJ/RimL family protein N-acetyltransferase